jgi:hypothetical protein
VGSWVNVGADIYDRSLAAMNDLIGRVVRAERMSGVKESGALKSVRDEYLNVSAPGGKRYDEAHEILVRFVRVAQDYYERARSNVTFARQWTRYEDQKLRKPVARLVQLQGESHKWLALRRLQGPRSGFVQLPNGQTVQLMDWGHSPLYDAVTLDFFAKNPVPVAHDVLVAAGVIRR